MNDQIIHGDNVSVLKDFPEKTFHLCVTSPPYDNQRTYNSHCDWDFEGLAKQIYRTLCDGGICCWVVADGVIDGSETVTSAKQKIFFKEECGFRIHQTMIYQKKNFSHPQKNRYHSVFEYVFIMSKGAPKVFNPLMDRKNKTAGCVGNLGVNTFTERDGSKSERSKKITSEFGMRHNVWLLNTRGQEEMCLALKHPAMMPKSLARDLILSFSNAGDRVVDPMAGSGTVHQMAIQHGRHCVSIDRNPEYIQMIEGGTFGVVPRANKGSVRA